MTIAVANFRLPPSKRQKLRRIAQERQSTMTRVLVDLIDNAPEPKLEEMSLFVNENTHSAGILADKSAVGAD